MANKFKGEKSFKVGEKTHKMRIGLNVSAEIEDMTGEPYHFFVNTHFGKGDIPLIKPSLEVFKCAYMDSNDCDEEKATLVAEQYQDEFGPVAIQTLILGFVIDQMTLANKNDGGGDSTEGGN